MATPSSDPLLPGAGQETAPVDQSQDPSPPSASAPASHRHGHEKGDRKKHHHKHHKHHHGGGGEQSLKKSLKKQSSSGDSGGDNGEEGGDGKHHHRHGNNTQKTKQVVVLPDGTRVIKSQKQKNLPDGSVFIKTKTESISAVDNGDNGLRNSRNNHGKDNHNRKSASQHDHHQRRRHRSNSNGRRSNNLDEATPASRIIKTETKRIRPNGASLTTTTTERIETVRRLSRSLGSNDDGPLAAGGMSEFGGGGKGGGGGVALKQGETQTTQAQTQVLEDGTRVISSETRKRLKDGRVNTISTVVEIVDGGDVEVGNNTSAADIGGGNTDAGAADEEDGQVAMASAASSGLEIDYTNTEEAPKPPQFTGNNTTPAMTTTESREDRIQKKLREASAAAAVPTYSSLRASATSEASGAAAAITTTTTTPGATPTSSTIYEERIQRKMQEGSKLSSSQSPAQQNGLEIDYSGTSAPQPPGYNNSNNLNNNGGGNGSNHTSSVSSGGGNDSGSGNGGSYEDKIQQKLNSNNNNANNYYEKKIQEKIKAANDEKNATAMGGLEIHEGSTNEPLPPGFASAMNVNNGGRGGDEKAAYRQNNYEASPAVELGAQQVYDDKNAFIDMPTTECYAMKQDDPSSPFIKDEEMGDHFSYSSNTDKPHGTFHSTNDDAAVQKQNGGFAALNHMMRMAHEDKAKQEQQQYQGIRRVSDDNYSDKSSDDGISKYHDDYSKGDRGTGVGSGRGGFTSDGIAIAKAVDDNQDGDDKPVYAAIEYDPNAKPPLYRNRRFQAYSAVGLILIAVIVTVVVVVTTKKTKELVVENPPIIYVTPPPSQSPTLPPTTNRDSSGIREYIEEHVLLRNGTFSNMTKDDPRLRTLDWILNQDARQVQVYDESLSQRYILGLLATSWDSAVWKNCGENVTADSLEGESQEGEGGSNTMCLVTYNNTDLIERSERWMSAADECDWFGVTCTGGVVRGLELPDNGLIGEIVPELGMLPYLHILDISSNCLYGTLPSDVGLMNHLSELNLELNSFSGYIPEDLYNLTNLVKMNLGFQTYNDWNCTRSDGSEVQMNYKQGDPEKGTNWGLEGKILETNIGKLQYLRDIFLSDNYFSGTIAPEIGNLKQLVNLNIENNVLRSTIPDEITQLDKMQGLFLAMNYFTGEIPIDIGDMKSLETFSAWGNGGNFTGSIPDSLYNLTKLQYLYIHRNGFTGTISERIGNLKNLQELLLAENEFTGTLPSELGLCHDLEFLRIEMTNLNGSMPEEVCFLESKNLFSEDRNKEVIKADCLISNVTGVEFFVCDCCTSCCNHDVYGHCVILD